MVCQNSSNTWVYKTLSFCIQGVTDVNIVFLSCPQTHDGVILVPPCADSVLAHPWWQVVKYLGVLKAIKSASQQ